MSETLTGRTTRTVTFIDKARGAGCGTTRIPAGRTVYVTEHPRTAGMFIIRIPGTLLEQDVNLSAVEPF